MKTDSRGAAFLAPLGNLEFVDGKFPSTADVLVEVTALDAVHQAAGDLAARDRRRRRRAARLSPIDGDALEVAHLYGRAGAGIRVQLLGVDRSAQGQAGGGGGRSLRRGHEVCDRRGALECGDYRAAA